MYSTLVKFGILCCFLIAFFAVIPSQAATDPFGELDRIYLDSVEAAAGEQVTVNINLQNDETLSSISVPLTYDPTLLTLTDISFVGSRGEYLETKLINPDKTTNIDGHFLVGMIVIFEDPLPAGDGLLFSTTFTVNSSATTGQLATIDSLFYPPGGELILVEATTSQIIEPNFTGGRISVGAPNRAPAFVGLSDQTTLEGDSLVLDVQISDPDNDALSLAVTSKPLGATFVDHGDGTGRFVWQPSFVGPFSADGSPFSVSFWGGDGDLSVEKTIEIEVVNTNRQPSIDAPSEVIVDAGEATSFELVATDPDFEAISWEVLEAHPNAVVALTNPAGYSWQSAVTDTGSRTVSFIARDPHGAADTSAILVRVRPATLYSLVIDSAAADLGEEVEIPIRLENLVPVAGFDLVFSYDLSGMTLLEVTNVGTRSESFETFTVTPAYNGNASFIHIVGRDSESSPGSTALAADTGTIAIARFRLAGELDFAGLSVPVPFEYLDGVSERNTLFDSTGTRIGQPEIFFINGRLKFNSFGQVKLGDINLNGIAYEIGDIIRFTNYFINPRVYGFDLLQFANSDVNRDGFVATVADLVTLINIVVKGTPPPVAKAAGEPFEATVATERTDAGTLVRYESSFAPAAALLKCTAPAGFDRDRVRITDPAMEVAIYQQETTLNVLIYSLDGTLLPAGEQPLLEFLDEANIELNDIALASAEGDLATVTLISSPAILPQAYTLYQNYPNPFNPETRIAFDLPTAASVRLEVFNILGRRVAVLQDGALPAGSHTLVWDGRDAAGQAVSSGVYLYRLVTEQSVQTKKMMLLK